MRLAFKLAVLAGALVAALGSAGVSVGLGGGAPSNTSLPSVSGAARDGSMLAASPGSWANKPVDFSYQWMSCDADAGSCTAIAGANSRQYTLQTTDVGHRVRVAVRASNKDGAGNATSRATEVVQAPGSAPKHTVDSVVWGSAQEDQTLTGAAGGWSGNPTPVFSFQWQRCAGTGGNCLDISGANSQLYKLVSADVAHTVRLNVVAKNSRGATLASSAETGLVVPSKVTAGGSTISVGQVSLPNRLVISGVQFSPSPIRSRAPIVARFRVTDTRGFVIQGALVYALGLPYSWNEYAAEQTTDASGWATIAL